MRARYSFTRLVREPLLLIYQMPKVGSQTIEATLQRSGWRHALFRLHFLSREYARPLEAGLRAPDATETWRGHVREQLQLSHRLRKVLALRKCLHRVWPGLPKVQVITAVREPIGLCLASTFENYYDKFREDGQAAIDYCRYVLTSPETLKYVENWFDFELTPFLGLDVYQQPFPKEQGYTVCENSFARVLVYRFEALGSLKPMLSSFLGYDVGEVVSRNLSRSKAYREDYEWAKQRLRFPAEFVARTCQSKLMQHFYSAEERRAFELRWTAKGEEQRRREQRVDTAGVRVTKVAG